MNNSGDIVPLGKAIAIIAAVVIVTCSAVIGTFFFALREPRSDEEDTYYEDEYADSLAIAAADDSDAPAPGADEPPAGDTARVLLRDIEEGQAGIEAYRLVMEILAPSPEETGELDADFVLTTTTVMHLFGEISMTMVMEGNIRMIADGGHVLMRMDMEITDLGTIVMYMETIDGETTFVHVTLDGEEMEPDAFDLDEFDILGQFEMLDDELLEFMTVSMEITNGETIFHIDIDGMALLGIDAFAMGADLDDVDNFIEIPQYILTIVLDENDQPVRMRSDMIMTMALAEMESETQMVMDFIFNSIGEGVVIDLPR